MKKQELISYLRKNMPALEGTDEEKELKVALYIYVELGKMKSFDEKYYYSNSKTKQKIYKLSKIEYDDIEKLSEKKKLVCVTLTGLYCNLLKEFGINAVPTQGDFNDKHVYSTIILKNGKSFMADLQQDLSNIQTHSKLKNFKSIDYLMHNDDNINLDNLLMEIGYIKTPSDYKDEFIKKLQKEIKNSSAKSALSKILENDNIYLDNSRMEIVEIKDYFGSVLKKLLPRYYKRKIYDISCYRENDKKGREYTSCIFSTDNNEQVYIYSKKLNRYTKVSTSKLISLQEDGLILGATEKENGVKILKKNIKDYLKQNSQER